RRSPLPEPAPEKALGPAPEPSSVLSYGPSLAQLDEIQVPSVHNLGFSGAGVIVAMLDTGYFKDHEAFTAIRNSGRLIAERDFIQGDGQTQNQAGDTPTQHNHGTYTWSALGGQMAGELYGPAYGAKFALAKTEDVTDEQPIEEDHWLAASEWADSLGARVISSSLGYLDWYTYEDMDGNTAVTTRAADIAARRNIVVATAAGNEGAGNWHYIIAPADGDSVLAVGAVNNLNEVEDFSSWGPSFDGRVKPEVVARGRNTHCATTADTDTYGDLSGTSLATPLVGGAAALVIQAHPTWSAWKVRYALIRTADTFATPDDRRGFGRIRVLNAINMSFVGVEDGEAPAFGVRLAVSPNPFSPPGAIELEMPSAGPLTLYLYSADGRRVRSLADGGSVPAGKLRLRWDGRDALGRALPAGIYFLRAEGAAWSRVAKVALTH
ncbi:MAG TPA: S8 family serine peptidase, partial [Candidatus Udaeobacter sp.]|nr:S8 family serine peptidase [Candidatus Udaeobacter sp.]